MRRAIAASLFLGGLNMALADGIQATIEYERHNGTLLLRPTASAIQAVAVEYEFIVEQKSEAGSSRSHQSGEVLVGPEPVTLVSSRVGAREGARIAVTLRLYGQRDGGRIKLFEQRFQP